jgi:hypothetical protein
MKRLWRRTDLYALPITLRYKGEKMFYTNYGALISNIVILTLGLFTLSYLQLMLSDSKLYSTYSEKISSQKTDAHYCTDSKDCPYLFGYKLINTTTDQDY